MNILRLGFVSQWDQKLHCWTWRNKFVLYILRKKNYGEDQEISIVNSIFIRAVHFPISVLGFCLLESVQVLCVLYILYGNSHVHQSHCGCKTLFPLSHLPSCFLFCLDLRGEVWEDILFRTEYSKVPHSLHIIHLWVSMLILSSVFLMSAERVTHLWIEQYVIRSHHKAMFPWQNIRSRFSIDPSCSP